ncbi:magnesium protoporphyrin IX methyltransferase [Thiorhodovibrio frisius]|uniref:Magnesium protoporphyrin IX methyltransferase n=1 Tax=Thiorhodovibrio frisius TaxID=631362 RepID=H8Z0X6_9GAMM|nr:magnesium protoporphyrin IX methyltransferase [Thiorhodovibrio frisius]EIC21358.1 magnesium protoporphyrin O-methyltransferase [Thiorhodovibrio frisius]WPL23944.1 magnesium protoporphyrin IX methyltransferase [Thiorhodovibrio frisius]
MANASYQQRRSQIETYFDRTAADGWKRLTSDAPLGRIRETVRQGRELMRQTLLDWMPQDLSGCRLLDAGCGTGLFSLAAARRGADVVAVDLSATLIDLARERAPGELGGGSVNFSVGDMLDAERGTFDYIVAMDSLIHYEPEDALALIRGFAAQARCAVIFTFAPRTRALALMHAVGQFFPRSDRSPAIVPIAEKRLRALIEQDSALKPWHIGRCERIIRGFYTSQGLELVTAS